MNWVEPLRFVISGLGYMLILISLIPLIRSNWWFIRIFDYPRSQKFWVNLSLLIIFLFIADLPKTTDVVFLVAIFLNQVYLLTQIWNYTRLAPIQMKREITNNGETIRLFVANVFQDNRDPARCHSLIEEYDPDLILLVETDEWWVEAMQERCKSYPFQIAIPLENTYGMILLSRFKIVNHSINYLVEPEVPSLVADIITKDGNLFRMYGLHPKPPVPGESDESTERDAEILIVGKEAKKCQCPVIVAGDLNDVAWSYTTNLFLKVSGLLDPRIGRGFFSTFHADYAFLRWPLDHVFCSSHFYLQDLKRLPSIGSDHFPIFIEIALMPSEQEANLKDEKHPDREELKMANEKIETAK